MELSNIDLVILIVVLVSGLIGLARGLLKEVLSLASWLAAFILALYFAPDLANRLTGQFDDGSVRLVVAFVAIFLVTLLVGAVIQRLTGALVKGTGLSGTDRFLGFLFGSARGAVVCLAVLMALRQFAGSGPWWDGSVLVPELLAFEQDVLDFMGRAHAWVTQLSHRE